jgi:hypothetical protein
MQGTQFLERYFYLFAGICLAVVLWVLAARYLSSNPDSTGNSGNPWANFSIWPLLFDRQMGFTCREIIMGAIMIAVVLGVIIFDTFCPVSSRGIFP